MSIKKLLPFGRRRPAVIPPGDEGDVFDPKPTGTKKCQGCGTKYPLGEFCGYCRGAIKLYREVANDLLEPHRNRPHVTGERPALAIYVPPDETPDPVAA